MLVESKVPKWSTRDAFPSPKSASSTLFGEIGMNATADRDPYLEFNFADETFDFPGDDSFERHGSARARLRTSTMPEKRTLLPSPASYGNSHQRAFSFSGGPNSSDDPWAFPHPAISSRAISGTVGGEPGNFDQHYAPPAFGTLFGEASSKKWTGTDVRPARTSSLVSESNSGSWSRVASKPAVISAPPQAPVFLDPSIKRPVVSAPNRFITRQLKQGTEMEPKPAVPREALKPRLKPVSSAVEPPIGIFIWGFGDRIRVKDIIDSFGCFGEMINGKL